MNALTRYVFRQLLAGLILVSAGLTCVVWLMQSLRFVEMIVNRGLTAGGFAYLIMLMVPNVLAIILPIALFAVVVFVYSRLNTDRELVVMRAAGMSQWAIARPALLLALGVIGLGYTLNLYLVPESYRLFRELQWDYRYSYGHIVLREGAFTEFSRNITAYVRERTKDNQLLGILVHDTRKRDRPVTWMAERGALVEAADGVRVVMFNGNRQLVDRETMKLSVLYFDKSTLEIEKRHDQGITRYREARERTLDELLHLEEDKLLNVKDYGKFTVEAHKRLTSPIAALGFTLVALACMLSGSFSRRTQTPRIVLAVGIVVTLVAVTLALENVCAKRLELIPLLYAHATIPAVVAAFFLVRAPRRRKNADEDLLLAGSV